MNARPTDDASSPRARLRVAMRHGLALLGYVALTLLYMRPAARVFATHLAPDPGDPLFNLVVLKWGIHEWHRGLAGFWNMPFFFPAKLVTTYSDHLFGPSTLATLFTAVWPNALAAYNALFLGSFVLCGWSTWYVLRRSGLGDLASFLGGCMFAFAPFRWDQMSHVQILLMQWIPLALWTWDRLLAAPTWRRALAFLTFYVLHVTGGSYLAYMLHIPLGIVLLCRAPRLWREQRQKALRVLIPTALVCAAVLVPLFRPYLAASKQQKRSRTEIQIYSASVLSYFTPGDHNLYDALWPHALHRQENVLFPGVAVSALTIAAAVRHRRARRDLIPPFAALTRGRQLALVALGLLGAVAWIGGELRTWQLSGGLDLSHRNTRHLAGIALALALPTLAILWRRRRDVALLVFGTLLALAGTWKLLRWSHADWAAFSTYRLGMTALGAGLAAWLLWRRWTPGLPRFLDRLDPWRRGLFLSGAACFLLTFPMVYLPMMKFLPGLSGMRVAARFFALVLFPLVVLAAGELDRRWREARPEKRRAFAVIAALVVLVDVAPRPINWEPLPSEGELAPVYHWLARQTAVDGVLELPAGDNTTDIAYMYAATLHWKPLVNGYSGYLADHYLKLTATCCHPLPGPQELAELRSWGVTHVLLHEADLTKRWARKAADAWAQQPGVSVEYEDGSERVYRVAPSTAVHGR